mmetsp:Transcript_18541/g.48128  ORF Transcript_18541/g.48128 Transcript_18541/m.48128 type:complete len:233 (+) Transcript_18541:236-934(+)
MPDKSQQPICTSYAAPSAVARITVDSRVNCAARPSCAHWAAGTAASSSSTKVPGGKRLCHPAAIAFTVATRAKRATSASCRGCNEAKTCSESAPWNCTRTCDASTVCNALSCPTRTMYAPALGRYRVTMPSPLPLPSETRVFTGRSKKSSPAWSFNRSTSANRATSASWSRKIFSNNSSGFAAAPSIGKKALAGTPNAERSPWVAASFMQPVSPTKSNHARLSDSVWRMPKV